MKDSGDLIAVGRIIGAHGIAGEVRVQPLTDFPERFDAGSVLLLVDETGLASELTILSSRPHKGHYLVVIDGLTDRTAAEQLRGSFLKIRPEDLSPLPEGEFYDFQLVGLAAVTEEGKMLGQVEEVLPTGSNLVLVVRDGRREVLLPYIDDVVRRVDLAAGEITVHVLEGLLPED